jgi:hypothetical protein
MIYFYEVSNGLEEYEYDSNLIASIKEYTKEDFKQLCKDIVTTLNANSPSVYINRSNELMDRVSSILCEKHGFEDVFTTAYFAVG